MCVRIFVCVCMHPCLCARVCVFVCVYLCLCTFDVCVCVHAFLCASVDICAFVYMWVRVRARVRGGITLSRSLCVWVSRCFRGNDPTPTLRRPSPRGRRPAWPRPPAPPPANRAPRSPAWSGRRSCSCLNAWEMERSAWCDGGSGRVPMGEW